MEEKRKFQRWQLIYSLRVFEQKTDDLMGHLVDISEEGMLLVSDEPHPTSRDFELWIDVPLENGGKQRVALNAHSLWTQQDANPDFYYTGFRLTNLDPLMVTSMRCIIDDLQLEH